jgi:hypothetical protein
MIMSTTKATKRRSGSCGTRHPPRAD